MEKKQNNLVVLNGDYTITNKEMNRQLNEIVKGLQAVEVGSWKYAIAIHQVITKELYKDDFQKVETFADYINTTKSNITKMVNAVNFAIDNGLIETLPYSVGKCYLLSTIDDYNDFAQWLSVQSIDLRLLSVHKLEDLLKMYKNGGSTTDDENDENAEKEKEVYIEFVLKVDRKERTFQIPKAVLLKYEKEQKKDAQK